MIYQFRGGLREEIQLALVLFEPMRYDEFYNMALKQETAQLKCNASKKRVSDATPSSSTQVASKQQKYWLPPPPFHQPYQQKSKGGSDLPTHPTLAFRTRLRLKLQDRVLRITVRFQRSRATSANRRVTMPTSASTRGIFLLLLLSDRQVQLWSSITPSPPRST